MKIMWCSSSCPIRRNGGSTKRPKWEPPDRWLRSTRPFWQFFFVFFWIVLASHCSGCDFKEHDQAGDIFSGERTHVKSWLLRQTEGTQRCCPLGQMPFALTLLYCVFESRFIAEQCRRNVFLEVDFEPLIECINFCKDSNKIIQNGFQLFN